MIKLAVAVAPILAVEIDDVAVRACAAVAQAVGVLETAQKPWSANVMRFAYVLRVLVRVVWCTPDAFNLLRRYREANAPNKKLAGDNRHHRHSLSL